MENIYKIKNSESGQSTVEYILLLAVLMSIGISVFDSQAFKNVFGPNSVLFDTMRRRMEYSYRHATKGNDYSASSYTGSGHHNYFNPETGSGRFFIPTQGYGP